MFSLVCFIWNWLESVYQLELYCTRRTGERGNRTPKPQLGVYPLSWSIKRTLLLNSNLRVVLVFAYQKNPDVLHMYVIGKPCDIRSTKVTHRKTGVTSPIELSGGFISANNKCLFNAFIRSRWHCWYNKFLPETI